MYPIPESRQDSRSSIDSIAGSLSYKTAFTRYKDQEFEAAVHQAPNTYVTFSKTRFKPPKKTSETWSLELMELPLISPTPSQAAQDSTVLLYNVCVKLFSFLICGCIFFGIISIGYYVRMA